MRDLSSLDFYHVDLPYNFMTFHDHVSERLEDQGYYPNMSRVTLCLNSVTEAVQEVRLVFK